MVERDIPPDELAGSVQRCVVAHGHDVVHPVDADALAAHRVREPLARPVDELLPLDPGRAVLADVTRLGREDDRRLTVDRQQHVRVPVHDHETAQIRDRALEARVLVAADDHRIESVSLRGFAHEPVPPFDLVLRQVRIGRHSHCCHESSTPFTSAQIASIQRRRHLVLAPEADDTAVEIVDLRPPSRLDVLEHRRFVVVRNLRLCRMVDQRFGIGVEHDALRRRNGLALVDETGDERTQVGPLAYPPVRQAGERADRVGRRVEDHLAPLRAARVGDSSRRHAAARARVCELDDLLEGRVAEGAKRRIAFDVPLHVSGLE